MIARKILIMILGGLVMMATINSQPKTYIIQIDNISQPEARPPVNETITLDQDRYATFSGAPLLIEFFASGFHCPNQDISFKISYVYRRVRPANFLEDPSLFVMEGYIFTTTVTSESCTASWTSPGLRDGIHTIGILAFDGSGAQSSWHYITIIKNNERENTVSYFPGGNDMPAKSSEDLPISSAPVVITDTPNHTFTIGKDPIQYVDIYFHTNYPFPVEYFYVEWTFTSKGGCGYSSTVIVYASDFNRGVFRLDMSSVFAPEWAEPSNVYGKCALGTGEFTVRISCKTAQGFGEPTLIIIRLV